LYRRELVVTESLSTDKVKKAGALFLPAFALPTRSRAISGAGKGISETSLSCKRRACMTMQDKTFAETCVFLHNLCFR